MPLLQRPALNTVEQEHTLHRVLPFIFFKPQKTMNILPDKDHSFLWGFELLGNSILTCSGANKPAGLCCILSSVGGSWHTLPSKGMFVMGYVIGNRSKQPGVTQSRAARPRKGG